MKITSAISCFRLKGVPLKNSKEQKLPFNKKSTNVAASLQNLVKIINNAFFVRYSGARLKVYSKFSRKLALNFQSSTFVQSSPFTYIPSFHLAVRNIELAISKPVKIGKSYIAQKKALLPIVWKKFCNLKNFCHGRLQMSFSRSGSFSNHFY